MKKDIEIVKGDGSDLNISEVSEHITSLKPKSKQQKNTKNIVVPDSKKININNDK